MSETKVYQKLKTLGVDVYPFVAPQSCSYPVITYFVVSERKKQLLNAATYGEVKRFQVDVWSNSYKEAKELKEEIVSLLVELEAEDINIQDLYEDDTKLFRELIQFYIKE